MSSKPEFPSENGDDIAGEVETVFARIDPSRPHLPRPAFGGSSITGSAGQYPGLQLWNPSGSGVLVLLDRLLVACTPNINICWRKYTAALGTLVTTKAWMDSRIAGAPVAEIRTEDVAVSNGTLLGYLRFSGLDEFFIPFGKMILAPGSGFGLSGGAVASVLYATFQWREVEKIRETG